MEKYESNEIIYSAAIRFFTDMLDVDPVVVLGSGACDQLDKFVFDILDKRAIALDYVAFCKKFA